MSASKPTKALRVLERFQPFRDMPRGKAISAKRVVCDGHGYDAGVAVLFADGTFTHSRIDHLDGVVAGFNVYAYRAVEAAQALRLLSRKDAEAFADWFRAQDAKRSIESRVALLHSESVSLGYRVSKAVCP